MKKQDDKNRYVSDLRKVEIAKCMAILDDKSLKGIKRYVITVYLKSLDD